MRYFLLFFSLLCSTAHAQEVKCEDISEGAIANLDLIQKEEILTASFGKKYNRIWLDAVLASSIKSSTDLIARTNVQIMRAYEKPSSNCRTYSFLPLSPADIKAVWLAQEKDRSALSKLFGLYVPKDSSSKTKSFHEGNTLILAEDTDKWTLVHEFMHHIFHIYSQKEGYEQDKTNQRALQTEEKLKSVFPAFYQSIPRKIPEGIELNDFANAFYDAITSIDEVHLHLTLEEATIEYLLTKEFDAGNLKFVDKSHRSKAASYVKSSSKKALEYYFYFQACINFLLEESRKNNLEATTEKLETLKSTLQSRVDELKALRDWAEKISPSVLNNI